MAIATRTTVEVQRPLATDVSGLITPTLLTLLIRRLARFLFCEGGQCQIGQGDDEQNELVVLQTACSPQGD
jgi:hypothetical protein